MDLSKLQKGKILGKQKSPAGHVEALVLQTDMGDVGFGATLSQPYQVYLRPVDPSLEGEKVVLGFTRSNGARIRWEKDRLIICYDEAAITTFYNKYDLGGTDRKIVESVEVVLERREKIDQCP